MPVIKILAKWRDIGMFQYPGLVPLLFPERICTWILAASFFIRLVIFIVHKHNFSNLFSSKVIKLSLPVIQQQILWFEKNHLLKDLLSV